MSLRPSLPEACRRALVDLASAESAEHQASCDFCARRAAARAALGPLVAARPIAPDALRRPAFLDAVYERAVELAEQGPVAQWVAEPPCPSGMQASSWQDCVQDSEVARDLMQRPAAPSEDAWSGVRRSVLNEVAAEAAARRVGIRGWRSLVAGAAAAAIIALISFSDGTSEEPVIVFTELREAPDVPFAVVRYGARD